jgi:hypothetical protein
MLLLQGKKSKWKHQDRWDREGLDGCIGPCADVFDFFVPINSDRSFFLFMISHLQWLLYLHFCFEMRDKQESVDRDKKLKCENVSTCENALVA